MTWIVDSHLSASFPTVGGDCWAAINRVCSPEYCILSLSSYAVPFFLRSYRSDLEQESATSIWEEHQLGAIGWWTSFGGGSALLSKCQHPASSAGPRDACLRIAKSVYARERIDREKCPYDHGDMEYTVPLPLARILYLQKLFAGAPLPMLSNDVDSLWFLAFGFWTFVHGLIIKPP